MGEVNSLNNMHSAYKYFEAVSLLDKAAFGVEENDAVERFMEIWSDNGKLIIIGPDPINRQVFTGSHEIKGFYYKKANKGFRTAISNLRRAITNAITVADNKVTVSGMKAMVNHSGEGMEITFTHNFTFDDKGKISSLQVFVGDPQKSDIAPMGKLTIKDMGRLAAVCWMVA